MTEFRYSYRKTVPLKTILEAAEQCEDVYAFWQYACPEKRNVTRVHALLSFYDALQLLKVTHLFGTKSTIRITEQGKKELAKLRNEQTS